MILGLGIDIVEIPRMAENLSNTHFMERVFTPAERDYIADGNLAAERAASNFAAKEALAKALGCGFAGCPPDCVETLRDGQGAPYVNINAKLKRILENFGATKAWVSITHSAGIAAAIVVLEGETCGMS